MYSIIQIKSEITATYIFLKFTISCNTYMYILLIFVKNIPKVYVSGSTSMSRAFPYVHVMFSSSICVYDQSNEYLDLTEG